MTRQNREKVAPLVGAWIEIEMVLILYSVELVAPLVGAWIEILYRVHLPGQVVVAPLVGAWIEIDGRVSAYVGELSLLSWERGLK